MRADARWVEDRTAELMAGGVDWRPGARELVAAVRAAGLRDRAGHHDAAAAGRHRARRRSARTSAGDPSTSPSAATRCRPASPIRRPTGRRWRALGVEPAECVVSRTRRRASAAGPGRGRRRARGAGRRRRRAGAGSHAARRRWPASDVAGAGRPARRPRPGRWTPDGLDAAASRALRAGTSPAAGDHEAGPLQGRHVGQRRRRRPAAGRRPGRPPAAPCAAPGRRRGPPGRWPRRGPRRGHAARRRGRRRPGHQPVPLARADARVGAGEQDACPARCSSRDVRQVLLVGPVPTASRRGLHARRRVQPGTRPRVGQT